MTAGEFTSAGRAQLLSWPGWGALAPAFEDRTSGAWGSIRERLERMFSEEELESAAGQVDTSYFTPPVVVDAVYALLRAAGFTGGAVLEPGCGSGRFMAAAPNDWPVNWTGVEIDPVSARIARAVNPGADIIEAPLQKTAFVAGSFDAVVGNVPFGQSYVYDPVYGNGTIHSYFIRRALDAVRPGGYVIVITSRHTMDSTSGIDEVIDETDARLIAAVRLPSGAFGSEGTEVVADILAFRKNARGARAHGWDNFAENRARADGSNPRPRVTAQHGGGQVVPRTSTRTGGSTPRMSPGTSRSRRSTRTPSSSSPTTRRSRSAPQLPLPQPRSCR
ncbi:methyltransferase domain-containing protein [Curtobacterium sp. MCBD17_040]|uniref:methyltransferase domain-containing protein n=1 Tax=Curtobacterium sp. MCBD17_040 TaxID=2175674 RepID=UPI0011B5D764|nr:methyltransferase domain-containing protein [Curtobacterium sp. MCBD17_040]WIB65376.1 methyltransferase domain-containing protein [Curtobacterium sp. MCBD17_040]